MQKVFGLLLFLTIFWVALPVRADELLIRGHHFEGAVSGSTGSLWVDLKAFANAVGATLVGDDDQGYSLSMKSAPASPQAGKVLIEGQEVESRLEGGLTMVSLGQTVTKIGGRVISKAQAATTEVSLKAKTDSSADPSPLDAASDYTLIEYYVPHDALCEYIQPALTQAGSSFKNVPQVHCNLKAPGADKKYLKYKQTPGAYPEVVLIDRQGKVLLQIQGNHNIANGLLKQMSKVVKN
jgi:hypothetical protein